MVVTRLWDTGIAYTVFSSKRYSAMVLAALAELDSRPTKSSTRMCLGRCFIFEIVHGSWESSVLDHVGVALELEGEREWDSFRESSVLEDPGANELPGHLGQDEVLSGLENRDFGNLGLLMQLFRGELRLFQSP